MLNPIEGYKKSLVLTKDLLAERLVSKSHWNSSKKKWDVILPKCMSNHMGKRFPIVSPLCLQLQSKIQCLEAKAREWLSLPSPATALLVDCIGRSPHCTIPRVPKGGERQGRSGAETPFPSLSIQMYKLELQQLLFVKLSGSPLWIWNPQFTVHITSMR